jgi:hypothetical protein
MKRREFMTLVGAAATWPLAVPPYDAAHPRKRGNALSFRTASGF